MLRADSDHQEAPAEESGGLFALATLALLVGAATGLLAAIFRLALEQAERLRDLWIARAHDPAIVGFALVVLACGAATAVAAWLVRRFSPHAAGSGIPHVEASLRGQLPAAPRGLIPVKFVGGILAIGSGLALGREGPSVQMGASVAALLGRAFGRGWPDCRVLIAAGAGAGLATAFNAPLAGAVFVLEELVQRFEHRVTIAALAASATAIAVARVLLGDAPDFQVATQGYVASEARPLFILLGGVAGLFAIAYNRTLLAGLEAAERLSRWSVEARAGLIGAAVGALAWFQPGLVGGGDALTQRTLDGTELLGLVPGILLLRFALGALSYAAGTPGGLFAPLLVLGAQSGLLFGAACRLAFPGLEIDIGAFALVGMAALFAGVVRAPLTGMVLVSEMTGNVTLLLPMLGACFTAMWVPTWLGNAPIYESLRERLLRSAGIGPSAR